MDNVQQFNLEDIIKANQLDTEELAKLLFPYVKYPKQAFDRVLKHETELDVNQLHILASFIGVFVSDLFNIGTWKSVSENKLITFVNGEYKAVVSETRAMVTLYKEDKILDNFVINFDMVTISQFINIINKTIEKYESDQSQSERQHQTI